MSQERSGGEISISTQDVKAKLKETLKSVKELLVTVKNATNKELAKTTPRVIHALDRSFDSAARELSGTLQVISVKTKREQLELLRAYRSFLQEQMNLIDRRINSFEKD